MKNYNTAQRLLISIGGIAEHVAGYMDHYLSDGQTPSKTHKRPLKGRGKFGLGLKAKFDSKNATPERLQVHRIHVEKMKARKQVRANKSVMSHEMAVSLAGA